MIVTVIRSADDISRAAKALVVQCPYIRRVHEELGDPPLRLRSAGFDGLARVIVSQQISIEVARVIVARIEAAFGKAIEPATFLDNNEATLRTLGLSRPKIAALRASAAAVASGALELDALSSAEAAKAREMLTSINGIGPWTADVYLLFCLGHPDAWPVGDVALQAGAGELLGLHTRPTAKELEPIGQRWRPYRGVAARFLWAYYGARRDGRLKEPLVV